MQLPDESERPTRAIATPPGQPTKREKLSDEDWLDFLKREADHKIEMADLAKTEYLREREAAYIVEIHPFLDDAKMKETVDNDSSLVKELRAKKVEIDTKFPPPEKL